MYRQDKTIKKRGKWQSALSKPCRLFHCSCAGIRHASCMYDYRILPTPAFVFGHTKSNVTWYARRCDGTADKCVKRSSIVCSRHERECRCRCNYDILHLFRYCIVTLSLACSVGPSYLRFLLVNFCFFSLSRYGFGHFSDLIWYEVRPLNSIMYIFTRFFSAINIFVPVLWMREVSIRLQSSSTMHEHAQPTFIINSHSESLQSSNDALD